ncbi:hypothetical protein QOZ80_8AG0616090 [Eleusine coracana subsp. coracana]|nr:hypothetical protein QOZ80_8AG0616090 [Eleusine coracana subsp. coracana]
MSCFGGVEMMRGSSSRQPWRWWRAKCAGIAATVGSRLRRSIKGLDGHRRRRRWRRGATSSVMHHRRFAPVYVDELYAHHHDHLQPSSKPPLKLDAVAAAGAGRRASDKATARVAAAATTTTTTSTAGARASGGKPRAAAAGVGAMRNILMRSPGRGGGGVLGVVKGMGEVDLRAELFIRRFKEDMRLQSQRSAEEFQAMLARGL